VAARHAHPYGAESRTRSSFVSAQFLPRQTHSLYSVYLLCPDPPTTPRTWCRQFSTNRRVQPEQTPYCPTVTLRKTCHHRNATGSGTGKRELAYTHIHTHTHSHTLTHTHSHTHTLMYLTLDQVLQIIFLSHSLSLTHTYTHTHAHTHEA